MIKDKILEDIKYSQKKLDADRLRVLRFLSAQIKNMEIEKNVSKRGEDLSEEEVMDVLRKEAKKRKEAIDLFKKGGREDLSGKEERDLEIIYEYLPLPPDLKAIEKTIDELIAAGNTNFNLLMKDVMQKMKGADGKTVSEIVKSKLNKNG